MHRDTEYERRTECSQELMRSMSVIRFIQSFVVGEAESCGWVINGWQTNDDTSTAFVVTTVHLRLYPTIIIVRYVVVTRKARPLRYWNRVLLLRRDRDEKVMNYSCCPVCVSVFGSAIISCQWSIQFSDVNTISKHNNLPHMHTQSEELWSNYTSTLDHKSRQSADRDMLLLLLLLWWTCHHQTHTQEVWFNGCRGWRMGVVWTCQMERLGWVKCNGIHIIDS